LADLAAYWRFLNDAQQAFAKAPLSKRKAMRVVMLADGLVDELFDIQAACDDVLEFRQALAAQHASMALVMDLAAHRRDGPTLELSEQQVPLAQYGDLSIEDFMVSLYNNHSVQRLMVVGAGAAPIAVEQLLDDALEQLASLLPTS
jgi:hypothetical protein